MKSMLGELYKPVGKALETAQAVLEEENVYAVNVAWGCERGCTYCYNRFRTGGHITFPKKPPTELISRQLRLGIKPDGVFLSFGTDPLDRINHNWSNTWSMVRLLRSYGINKVATLSKQGLLGLRNIRNGVTIVSLSEKFREKFEPKSPPIEYRIAVLEAAHEEGEYTWVSIEPFPCPEIFQESLIKIIERLSFVDFMIFGKWNYDKRANTAEAKEFYRKMAELFVDFCKHYGIRHHVKSDVFI